MKGDALTVKEQEIAAFNHLSRWRLGLQDQLQRVRERGEQFRAAADECPPAFVAVGSTAEANWALVERWRLRNDVHFLLIAVRNITRSCDVLQGIQDQEEANRAISEFAHSQPHADLLRNVHEHVDEYMAGRGRQKHWFLSSPTYGSIEVKESDIEYEIGGHTFRIEDIAHDALTLSKRVIDARQRRLYEID